MADSIILDSTLQEGITTEPVGFGPRLGATVIDFLVLIPVFGLLWYAQNMMGSYMLYALSLLLSALYKPVMEGVYGATVGKMAIKAKVVNEDGTPISIGDAFIRYIPWLFGLFYSLYTGYIFLNNPDYLAAEGMMEKAMVQAELQQEMGMTSQIIGGLLGFLPLVSALFMLGNARKQAAHDMMAKTMVVYKASKFQ